MMGGMPGGPWDPSMGPPPAPPTAWQTLLAGVNGVMHFFGRLSFLVDENAHAVHFFISALLQLLDRAGSLYAELARFVLRILLRRTASRKAALPPQHPLTLQQHQEQQLQHQKQLPMLPGPMQSQHQQPQQLGQSLANPSTPALGHVTPATPASTQASGASTPLPSSGPATSNPTPTPAPSSAPSNSFWQPPAAPSSYLSPQSQPQQPPTSSSSTQAGIQSSGHVFPSGQRPPWGGRGGGPSAGPGGDSNWDSVWG